MSEEQPKRDILRVAVLGHLDNTSTQGFLHDLSFYTSQDRNLVVLDFFRCDIYQFAWVSCAG